MPSLFSWTSENKYAQQRTERQLRRHMQHVPGSDTQENLARCDSTDIAAEVTVEMPAPTEKGADEPDATSTVETVCGDAWSQTDVDIPFDIVKFMFDDDAIHYYTGLENYSKLMYVLSTLGQTAYYLSYYAHRCENLSVPNQFFLVLIKLRVHVPNFQLSRTFAISENSVSNIFITWINFMALQRRELDIMPSRDMTSFHMPDDYVKNFLEPA